MAPLLEVRNLVTRFYTEGTRIHAVNGISYTVETGESVAIVGESGSGKSVSVMSLMGLIRYPPGRVEEGQAFFKGRDLLKLSPEEMRKVRGREIAMVFQDPMTSLNPVLPVGLQLVEPLQAHMGLDKQQARERAAQLLSLVGLPNAADRLKDFPFQFSGGQRQRIMMLRDAQSLNILEDMPWMWLPPGLMIGLAVLSINFIGDGLRDALDPRSIL